MVQENARDAAQYSRLHSPVRGYPAVVVAIEFSSS